MNLQTARLTGLLALALGWLVLTLHVAALEQSAPRIPDPDSGQTVPVLSKTVTVYMTAFDARVVQLSTILTIILIAGIAAITIGRRLWRGRN